jgi:hypothetical protein
MGRSLLGRCQCRACRRGYMRWLESLGRHRAAGEYLWLMSLVGRPALAELLWIVTNEPVRSLTALDRARLGVVAGDQPVTIAITVSPLPAVRRCLWCPQGTAVVALPRDQPFTVAQLRAHGIDVHALPSPDAYDDAIGYQEDRPGMRLHIRGADCPERPLTARHQAIVTLEEILPALGDDEVRVLAMVGTRLAAGQRRYGRLSLRTDRRDWHTEAIEECADGLAYLAAALVRVEGQRG